MDLKNTDKLFSTDSIKFDTRKVLNRAEKSNISSDFIEKIESGLTSEQLNGFKFPVFRYHGQITLHGNFSAINENVSIGGYKNMILNQNGSLGIKYNAIDYEKKSKLGAKLSYFGWHFHRDSSTEYYSKTFEPVKGFESQSRINAINEYNSIKVDLFYVTKTLLIDTLSGRIYLIIYIKALFENEINDLFEILTGKTQQDLDLAIELAKIEREKSNAEWKLKQEAEAKLKKEKLANSTLNQDLDVLKAWDRTFVNGLHIVTLAINYWNEPYLIHYELRKKGAWYSARYFETENLNDNVDFDSYRFTEKKRTGKTPDELIKRLGKNIEYKIFK